MDIQEIFTVENFFILRYLDLISHLKEISVLGVFLSFGMNFFHPSPPPPDNGANRALLYPQAGIPDLRGSRQGLKVSLFFTPTLFNPRGLNREGATTSVEKKAIRTQLGAAAHRGTRNFEI